MRDYGSNCRLYQPQSRAILYVGGRCRRMLLAGCTKRYADRRGATTGCKISYPLIPSHNYRAAHRCLPYDTIAYAMLPPPQGEGYTGNNNKYRRGWVFRRGVVKQSKQRQGTEPQYSGAVSSGGYLTCPPQLYATEER